MNEMINALRYERILDFRERYRNIDVLLVDDIQFIGGQGEHADRVLPHLQRAVRLSKQIVISSDAPPHEITALEERLRSRFEWGLIADIQPPDLETKVAILTKKADADAVPLPDNVAIYIAGKIRVERPRARRVADPPGRLRLDDRRRDQPGRWRSTSCATCCRNDERVVTIDVIQKFVADYYQLTPERAEVAQQLQVHRPAAPGRDVHVQVADAGLAAGDRQGFGGKHHSTVIHSIKKIDGHAADATPNSAR